MLAKTRSTDLGDAFYLFKRFFHRAGGLYGERRREERGDKLNLFLIHFSLC